MSDGLDLYRSRNRLLMVAGTIVVLVGIILLAVGQKSPGMVVLIIGVAFLVISWTISGFFSRMDFNNMMNEKKYGKK